jgi:hypothetical protein
MNSYDINHDPEILSIRRPPRQRPWMLFGKSRSTHVEILLRAQIKQASTGAHIGGEKHFVLCLRFVVD